MCRRIKSSQILWKNPPGSGRASNGSRLTKAASDTRRYSRRRTAPASVRDQDNTQKNSLAFPVIIIIPGAPPAAGICNRSVVPPVTAAT